MTAPRRISTWSWGRAHSAGGGGRGARTFIWAAIALILILAWAPLTSGTLRRRSPAGSVSDSIGHAGPVPDSPANNASLTRR